MKKLACCVAWVIALLCSHSSHAVLPYRQNIKLNEFGGEIHGSLEEDGTHSTFYGVSYAQSPPTRFKTGVCSLTFFLIGYFEIEFILISLSL